MTDNNNNQAIFGKYRLPEHARDMIHVVTTDAQIQIRWGTPDGIVLAYWPVHEAQHWNGHVKIGGHVERLHARELGDVVFLIAEVVGGVLPIGYQAFPSLEDMQGGVFAFDQDAEPFAAQFSYPLIMAEDSPFAALAQDALVSNLSVDVIGKLADDVDGWQNICGLPLLIESLTLLAQR